MGFDFISLLHFLQKIFAIMLINNLTTFKTRHVSIHIHFLFIKVQFLNENHQLTLVVSILPSNDG
jgi:hypothetical protein